MMRGGWGGSKHEGAAVLLLNGKEGREQGGGEVEGGVEDKVARKRGRSEGGGSKEEKPV